MTKENFCKHGIVAGERAWRQIKKYKALSAPPEVQAGILMIGGRAYFGRDLQKWVWEGDLGSKGGAYLMILRELTSDVRFAPPEARMMPLLRAYAIVIGRTALSLKALSRELGFDYFQTRRLLLGMASRGMINVELVKDLDNVYV